eukprot:CAMPEP_0201921560 /NCGR_PEP_ID=MMETSP0903-20130614/9861_1 /ASSEMBLY_ACC=CAM_ASM_000552 /TAXON_ID=420261 /ORGANISM="Thalassiosira antarctica, Strain CCMP982" /LENGTH=88 /DNA_ID=CAMNT_0048458551 /DNA_START=60 /DNA_END=323 /DNA_ORIENTATION=-
MMAQDAGPITHQTMAGLPEEGNAFDGFGFKRDAAGFSQTDDADLQLACATKIGQDKGVMEKPKVCDELHPDSKAMGGEFKLEKPHGDD